MDLINVGSSAGDGQGDILYTAFSKCNSNFTESYSLSLFNFTFALAIQASVSSLSTYTYSLGVQVGSLSTLVDSNAQYAEEYTRRMVINLG